MAPMDTKTLPLAFAAVILVLAGGILWFVLTRPSPEGPGPSATSTPSGAEKLSVDDTGPYHDIHAYYPSKTPLASASTDASAVFVMKTFAESEAQRFRENNVEVLTQADIELFGVGEDRKYVLDADYDIHESPVTVSYVYHLYADTLGAHPNAYYRTFTFDLQSGEELHIDDLFMTADYLDVLSNESRRILKAQIAEASAVPEDELDTSMLDAGTTPFSDNFQNFYLEGNDLVIVFPPYQVGPWVLGTQEAHIPRSALGNTLKARYR
jgi:hypothetical protein